MSAWSSKRCAALALPFVAACFFDPQSDLDRAALKIDVGGIMSGVALLHVVVAGEAGEEHTINPEVSGASAVTLFVTKLASRRFAVQVEARDAKGKVLQCRRVLGVQDEDDEGEREPTEVLVGFEPEDAGPCDTVAGCLGAEPPIEVCNGEDDDCNGVADDGLGEFRAGIGACACEVPACAGGEPETCEPGAPAPAEVCNGQDDDCDGDLPEAEQDQDGDGFMACAPCSSGSLRSCGDCDDHDPERAPGRPEVCDGKDNDCSGFIDDGISCP
jgi:Putative metal-binding motif